MAEDRIFDLESMTIETSGNEEKKKRKRLEKGKTRSEYPGNCGTATKSYMSGDNRRRRETERRNRNEPEEIRTENIPKLMAETTLQIQDAQRTPRRIDAFQRLLPPKYTYACQSQTSENQR